MSFNLTVVHVGFEIAAQSDTTIIGVRFFGLLLFAVIGDSNKQGNKMKHEHLRGSRRFSFTPLSSLRVPQLSPAPLYDTIRIATKKKTSRNFDSHFVTQHLTI